MPYIEGGAALYRGFSADSALRPALELGLGAIRMAKPSKGLSAEGKASFALDAGLPRLQSLSITAGLSF